MWLGLEYIWEISNRDAEDIFWQFYDKYLMYIWQICLTKMFEQRDGCDVAGGLMQTYGRLPVMRRKFSDKSSSFKLSQSKAGGGIEACDRALTRLFPTKTKTTPHIFQETSYLPSHSSNLCPCGIQICLLSSFGFVRCGPNCISLILWSVFVCAAVIRDLLPIFSWCCQMLWKPLICCRAAQLSHCSTWCGCVVATGRWCGFVSCDVMWISSRFLWRWLGGKNWEETMLDEPWAILAPCISCLVIMIMDFFQSITNSKWDDSLDWRKRDHKDRKVCAKWSTGLQNSGYVPIIGSTITAITAIS